MALILVDESGNYVSECAICGKTLAAPIFATSGAVCDPSHDLYRYHDAGMHWDCYANWSDQARFASQRFEAASRYGEKQPNPHCPVLHKSDDIMVSFVIISDEIRILSRFTGSTTTVTRTDWPGWLAGEWRTRSRHPLEANALERHMPELLTLCLPPLDPAKVKTIAQSVQEILSRRPRDPKSPN